MIKNLILATVVMTLTGCASMFTGTTDTVTLNTKNNKDKSGTECQLHNNKGTWEADDRDTLTVSKSNKDLIVDCENSTQEGSASLVSETQAGYLFLGFLLDFCIFTCTIDVVSDAAFDYPSNVTVRMKDKDGV